MPGAFEETVIDVPLRSGTVDIQKQARVVEEVVVGKEAIPAHRAGSPTPCAAKRCSLTRMRASMRAGSTALRTTPRDRGKARPRLSPQPPVSAPWLS